MGSVGGPAEGSIIRRDRVRVVVAYVVGLAVAVACGALATGVLSAPGAIELPAWLGHPVGVAALGDLAATLVVFGFSVLHGNSSVYDPYWSVAPPVILLFWMLISPPAAQAGALVLMGLVLVWSVRLTVNWVLRWRGLDDEDWRYAEFREGRGYWWVSLGGFHLLPTVLVFLGCLPAYFVVRNAEAIGPLDVLAYGVITAGVWLEWVADRELRRFRVSAGGSGRILDTGPWGWCRHPNYLGELLFWWGIALAGIAAGGPLAWSVTGAASITLLFAFASFPMMERRLAAKPGFEEYAARTPLIIPRFRRAGRE